MERFGTIYGGWMIPKDIDLDTNSIIYSGGVGEDVSFDLAIHERYRCNVVLIDPTKRSIRHWKEIQKYYKDKESFKKFNGSIEDDYLPRINALTPDFSKFTYVPQAIGIKKGVQKFFKPKNRRYVSHSLIRAMASGQFDLVPVNTLDRIMNANGHTHIDILKLDIEGSEVAVLNDMLDKEIYPRYLCVEFDLVLKKKDRDRKKTNALLKRLKKCGYTVIDSTTAWNMTFKLNSNPDP